MIVPHEAQLLGQWIASVPHPHDPTGFQRTDGVAVNCLPNQTGLNGFVPGSHGLQETIDS
ncbi:hypothetical protein GCM10023156_23680 [Novipirellula rosea]|uniref:Uncharacterized protein n=1 Tax=Novipirellula rosea TaxID=1031540 RepID=A0ABP8MPA5_9BACT